VVVLHAKRINAKRAGVKHTGPYFLLVAYQAGAVALPGLTSVPGLPPDEASLADGGELFGERGGRPAMMSLI
jgi:hypothetical protein